MFRKFSEIILLTAFLVLLSAFSVCAQCSHDFTADESNGNIVINDGFTHSYRCLNNCGAVGTASSGVNGKEKCSLTFVSEKKATCISKGEKVYLCTVCYRSKRVPTQTVPHSYRKTRKNPTCTSQGYDLYTCTVCGDSYKDNIRQTLEHLSDGGVIKSQPTYSKKGVLVFSCRVCGCSLCSKSLPKLLSVGKAPGKVSGFKVKSRGTATVNLVWKKSEGAASYKLLYSTDKKKWKTVTVKKTSASVKNLKSACKYYFKIYAVGQDGQSSAGKTVSVCTKPSRASFTKVTSPKKYEARLQWKKLSRVSGYELSYTADSFSRGDSVKTVKVSGNKKTVKGLKSGKTYKFRIRAYKTVSSERLYGAYSKVKTVKIK